MSTQHRPTFHAAVATKTSGYGGFKSIQVSAKDQNAHTKLKFRKTGQNSQEEMRQADLRRELQRREAAIIDEKKQAIAMVEREEKKMNIPLLLTDATPGVTDASKFDDADEDFGDKSEDSFGESSDEDDDDDDEDEEAELQRELEKIKAERLAAAAKKEEEEQQAAEKKKRDSALRGNPLIGGAAGGASSEGDDEAAAGYANAKVKRRWNDDVVFRNQAASEPETKKRFVNDTIRNDFHRSFLKKYIQ